MTDVVGLRFVAEGETQIINAIQRVDRAEQELERTSRTLEAAVKRGSATFEAATTAYLALERAGMSYANVLKGVEQDQRMAAQAAQHFNDRLLGLDRAFKSARDSAQVFEAQARAVEQAKQGYDRLRASIDPVIAAQQRMRQAHDTVRQALANETITRQQAADTLRLYRQRLRETGQSTVAATDITGRLRQQFLATANSIAILDGPLGGIASRFSAFGILIGRTGLLIGGVLVGFAALGAVLNRGIRNLTEWEAANARVNAILQTTGYQAGLTGAQIRSMTSQIALSTLESEQSVMQAAQRLLTFRDIAGEVFEDVLRAAADMAALGFGTIESETVKLAKALEDPAQALTSLSRAGIVFTRQQRAVIISLVESGRQAEAMERILANVNARVGGAAEAAARDTLAGAFDTIGQAVSRAVREFAQATLEVTFLDRALQAVAARVSDYAGGPATLEQRVADSRSRLAQLRQSLREAEKRSQQDPFVRSFGSAALGRGQRLTQGVQPEIEDEERRLRILEDQLRVQEQQEALARARQRVSRDAESLDSLSAEIDLRREILGLTEDEHRLQRSLAQLGLRNLDIEQRVSAYATQLRAAGIAQAFINALTEDYRRTLREVATEVERARDTTALERQARSVMANTENLRQQVDLMHLQVAALQAGADVTEARAWAEEQTARRMAEMLLSAEGVPVAVREAAAAFLIAQDQARRVAEQLDAAQKAANFRLELEKNLEGLQQQLEVLDAQIVLLEAGVDFTIAQRLAEIEVQKARVQTQIVTQGITDELAQQLAYLNAMSGVVIEIGAREARVASFRPARGGGGSTKELETLESISTKMLERIERERVLLGLQGQARMEQEAYYELIDRLKQLEIPFREENVRAVAAEIAARRQLNVETQRQQALAQNLGQTLGGLFMAATRGANAFRQALSGVLTNLATLLANAAFTNLLRGSGLLGPVSNLGGALLGSANGNVFTGGNLVPFAQGAVIANMNRAPGANVIPFANGGVVNRPTTFPMRNGQTGLMGEAGPEAIMPLRRGRDGKLGVAAQAQAAPVDVRVYVDENGNWQAAVERIADKRVQRQGPTFVRQSVQAVYAANSERKLK